MTRVKVCGIRDKETAHAAVAAGVDALGFVFVLGSRRWVAPDTARAIIVDLPSFVCTVGVFVNAPAAIVKEIAAYCRLQALQFHGEETPRYCASFDRPVIKAIRFRGPDDALHPCARAAGAILVDTYVPDQTGGTGRTLDWESLRGLKWPRPLILAGGLTPQNVTRAITLVRPWAVDVSSGVETDGRKDPEKIRAFVRAAKTETSAGTGLSF